MNTRVVLFIALAAFTVFYVVTLVAATRNRDPNAPAKPTTGGLATGFVTNFFDTLGIGSFATTTSIFRFWNMVPDEKIPGTLNVGHTLPVIAQAFIFTAIVPVDPKTLVLMIAAAVAGAWFGAGVVASLPRRGVQIGMGGALVVAAGLFLMTNLGLFPAGGNGLALSGVLLIAGIVGNFALGALMTLGIGLYAPCMILVSLLGMSPTAAFPIMMGSCAFLQPVSSARFIRKGAFDLRGTLGLALGGIPAVLIAAFIVKSLPLVWVRWLVICVVLYAAIGLLRAAQKEKLAAATPMPAPRRAAAS